MKTRYIHGVALATVLILGTVSVAAAAGRNDTPRATKKAHSERKPTVKPGRPGSFAKSYRMDAELTRRSKGLAAGLQTSSVIVTLEEGKDAKDLLGIEVLSLGASGFRVFLSKKPIQTADDVRGIRLRVPEIPTWVEMARSLGANPTPIPAGEIYTALQTGVIDAFESPADFILSSKNYEVAGYITRTHHIFTEVSMMASARKMASLPVNVQKVIRESAFEAVQKEMWEANLKAQESAWNDLAKRIKANPNPDIASFRSKMAPVINGFIGKAGAKGKAFVEAVQAAGKA